MSGIATAAADVGARHTSSHSSNGSTRRFEAAGALTGVLARDTTNRASAVLTIPATTIPATAWRTLLAEIRD